MRQKPPRGPERREGGALPAPTVFAVLLVLVLVGAAYALSQSTGTDPAPATVESSVSPSSTDQGLTDAEAVARFQELDSLRLASYRDRDMDLLSRVFLPGGPPERIARREIRSLIRRDLLSQSQFDTQELSVTSNREQRIVLRQIVHLDPKIVTEGGVDVTGDERLRRLVLRWVLRWDGSQWLIADSIVMSSRAVTS